MNAIAPEKRRLNHLSTAQPNVSYVWHTMAKRQILFVCNLAYGVASLSLHICLLESNLKNRQIE